jgi:cbb3-type cytochrome oxidase subunit 1
MILLASIFFVVREELPTEQHARYSVQIQSGFWIANISLALFFAALILAGIGKGLSTALSFQEMMLSIRPYLMVFTLSGVTMMLGLWIILWQAFRLIGDVQAKVA